MKKRIELVKMRASDLKTGFGNPRKISKKKMEELEQSLRDNGDFGIFLIDEDDNVIAGNQRLKAIQNIWGPDTMLDCKRLIGYTQSQLRAINIKDNTHVGEWDLDILADWTADPNLDLGLKETAKKSAEDRKIPSLELIAYEKYNYVLLVCKTEMEYDELVDKLGIRGAVCKVTEKRKIKARAIWYEKARKHLFGEGDTK